MLIYKYCKLEFAQKMQLKIKTEFITEKYIIFDLL